MSLLDVIKGCPKVLPKYSHEGERGINPAFCNLEDNQCPLPLNQKRIWVFRSDLQLVTGVKNHFAEDGNTTLKDVVIENPDKKSEVDSRYDHKDRYGHPSLALAEEKIYDGSIYYAGWIAQREKHLEVFLQSGRYHNNTLSFFQRQCMEIHIARKFMKAYGKQRIVFIDHNEDHPNELFTFLKNEFVTKNKTRTYVPAFIDKVTEAENAGITITIESLATIRENFKNNVQQAHATEQKLPAIESLTAPKTTAPKKEKTKGCFERLFGKNTSPTVPPANDSKVKTKVFAGKK